MTATTATKTMAWFVVWDCGCCETSTNVDALPDVCPGHGTPRIVEPERLAVLNEFIDIHECSNNGTPCPAVQS